MSSLVSLASLAAALALVPLPSRAQPTDSAALAARIAAYLAPLAARDEFAGTVLVARDGRVLFERSYGRASVELGVPNANGRRYRIHSVTKQLTATAVAILAERGAVDLDASVRAYLPELPERWAGATVRQLLTHTSGLPQAEPAWFAAFQRHGAASQLENLARIAPTLAADTTAVRTGAAWAYNNFGYDLLACVVERVSGMEFSRFLETAIFAPAGMTGAGVDARAKSGNGMYVGSAVVPGLAHGYNGAPARPQSAAPAMFGSAGAGGVYATARDLLAYDRALTANRLVSAATLARMTAPATSIRPGRGYGEGWFVSRTAGGVAFVHHSGGNNGYVADYARYPETGVCVVVLSNYGFVHAEEIRAAIAAIVLGEG